MIQLGQLAKDKVTGFTGILTSRTAFLTGCDQYGITPQVNKGKGNEKPAEPMAFDEGRIEVIGRGILPKEVIKDPKKPGGPSQVIKGKM